MLYRFQIFFVKIGKGWMILRLKLIIIRIDII